MIRLIENEIKVVWKRLQTCWYEIRKGGHSKMTLDWLVYVLGVVAVVFLVGMFFRYKKHNRYAD